MVLRLFKDDGLVYNDNSGKNDSDTEYGKNGS